MSEWSASSKRVDAVLFDLGNTLVSYYRRDEFLPILERSIAAAAAAVDAHRARHGAGSQALDVAGATAFARRFNTERADYRIWPLADRLGQILGLDGEEVTPELHTELAERFLEPIFAAAQLNEQAIPVLQKIRALGKKSAIVSNTPWGTPAGPWHRELARHGLLELVDAAVFCVDVGWRKPAPQLFEHALARLEVVPSATVFVGDDAEWDVAGARRAGIAPILLGEPPANATCQSVTRLDQVLALIE